MTDRPEPRCAIASWCALGLGHGGGCSIARPRDNPTPIDVLVKAALALVELGVSTKKLTQADFILFPDPVGAIMSTTHERNEAAAAQGEATGPDPKRGSSAAYEESAHTAQSYSYRYKQIAHQIGELVEEVKHLAELDIRDPGQESHGAISGRYKPALLTSRAIKFDGDDAVTRLERVQLHVQGRAGVWDTEAARLRYRSAQLEAEELETEASDDQG